MLSISFICCMLFFMEYYYLDMNKCGYILDSMCVILLFHLNREF